MSSSISEDDAPRPNLTDGAGQGREHRADEGAAVSDGWHADLDLATVVEPIHRILDPFDRNGLPVRRLLGGDDHVVTLDPEDPVRAAGQGENRFANERRQMRP